MDIQAQNIVPTPLREKILKQTSDVWNRNFVCTKGEKIKIKAASGTGKTTLIHILYKLRTDFEGTVEYNEQNIAELTENELANTRQSHISIVFQDLRLFPNLTAKENIELKRVLQKPMYESIVIDEMATHLGIEKILHQPAALCSYGEQQRIAIIRALIQPFELLLMDEPFSHLDSGNTVKAVELIQQECAKRKAGFILTDLDNDDYFNYTKKLNL
jgi:putative ABC transport system ATP-binding protein